LSFPENERIRLDKSDPKLEAHDSELAQRAVPHAEVSLRWGKRHQWHVLAPVLHVVEFEVTLTERTATNVLAAQAHLAAFEEEASKSHGFPRSPIHSAARQCFAALLHETLELWMQVEVRRDRGDAVNDLLGQFAANRSGGSSRLQRRERSVL
jgi:hypothetical protein